jgi:hypothetical protein
MADSSIFVSRRADAGALTAALLFPSLLTWLYFVALARSEPAIQQIAYAAGKTIQFVFPLVWVVGIRRQGPPWKAVKTAGLAEGLLFGAAVLVAILVGYHVWLGPAGLLDSAGEAITKKLAGFNLGSNSRYLVLAAFYALLHSLLEEYYWRWFVFGQLRRLARPGAAIAVSSLGFMGHHVIVLGVYFGWASPATVVFSLGAAVGGAYWAWLYHRSGSLLGPWLSHLLVDAAIFAVGYQLLR